MFNGNKKKSLLILGGLLLGVLIYFAPNRISKEEGSLVDNHEESHEHAEEASDFKFAEIDSLDQVYIDSKLELIGAEPEVDIKLLQYDSLIQFSIQRNYPPLVANFSEQKAILIPNDSSWMLAGDNYFKAFRLSKNQSKEMLQKAIASYEKAVALNPQTLEAQTAIGVAYVEGAAMLGEMPMKGIGILKEVLNKEPENIDALTNLGYFAIQSGQFDIAIERFETVLKIDPKNAEAYIYLTDIYLSQENIEKGIETLEKYKALVNDPLVKQQVDEYIKEIKNK